MRAVRPRIATQTTYLTPRSPTEQAALLAEVIERHSSFLRSLARRHSRIAAEGEDALQNAYVQFLRKYEGPAEDQPAIAWLNVVTRRCAWEIARRESRRAVNVGEVVGDAPGVPASAPSPARGPEELVEAAAETAGRLGNLRHLKRNERVALILLALGFSYAEIAQGLDWTMTKVNRCIAEGRSALRRIEEGGRK